MNSNTFYSVFEDRFVEVSAFAANRWLSAIAAPGSSALKFGKRVSAIADNYKLKRSRTNFDAIFKYLLSPSHDVRHLVDHLFDDEHLQLRRPFLANF